MSNQNSKNIILSRAALSGKEGVVVLPLKKWREIEDALEDLEMYKSNSLAKEIEKRRKNKTTVSLEKVLQKYNV